MVRKGISLDQAAGTRTSHAGRDALAQYGSYGPLVGAAGTPSSEGAWATVSVGSPHVAKRLRDS